MSDDSTQSAAAASVDDDTDEHAVDEADSAREGAEEAGGTTTDDDDFSEDFDDDFDDATCAERVLESCLRAIVDRPEDIDSGVDEHDRRLTLHVRVASEDMGKIIGKRGRVANALRTLVKAAGSREGYSAAVEIDD